MDWYRFTRSAPPRHSSTSFSQNFQSLPTLNPRNFPEAAHARTVRSPTAQKVKSATSAPKKNPDVLTWRFVELINVAVEIGIVSKGAEKLSHSVREYRNLVHIHKELSDGIRADEQEARIALNVLNLIDRDLRP